MVFSQQLKLVAEPDKFRGPEPKFHNFFVVLGSKVSPISVVMPSRLLAAILSSAFFASRSHWHKTFFNVIEKDNFFLERAFLWLYSEP
jgi:hypothetical protein